MISRRNRRKLKKRDQFRQIDIQRQQLSEASKQGVTLARSLTGAIYYTGNDVKIFNNGKDKFDALIADLRAAENSINLQYYIFENDNIGREIREILMQKARAGVTVRVIYDHIGCLRVKRAFFKEMRRAGVQVYPFFRVSFPPFATRINWRNHRKIVVIDGKIGYIGGMNIADRYIDGGKFDVWRDIHVRLTGPAIGGLLYSFAVDWNFMGQPLINEPMPPAIHSTIEPTIGVQTVTSGPTSQWRNIALIFLNAIANAKDRVFIQTPYFLPTESLLKALQSAALSRVDVRIMIPRKGDSNLLKYASFSYISECLRAGIKFYLYDAGMLHSKVVIVDDEFSTIGSTNFDFRSFEHNFESNILIYSPDINRDLRRIFFEDLKSSVRVTPTTWRKRPFLNKCYESVLRLLSPIL